MERHGMSCLAVWQVTGHAKEILSEHACYMFKCWHTLTLAICKSSLGRGLWCILYDRILLANGTAHELGAFVQVITQT